MTRLFVFPALCALLAATAAQSGGITSPADPGGRAAFDILSAEAARDGDTVTFRMTLAATAGADRPAPVGTLAGAPVHAYVWPTSLDPAAVGFEGGTGILALAATSHPDFDDTPLEDENGDGDPANDGADWHSHWVVLAEDAACGAGLKVRDVSPGQDLLPATAPLLPIALDSPGMSPILDGGTARITVSVAGAAEVSFDAVTAELAVDEKGEAPLLCVTGVHDVASGDLSLPGRVVPGKVGVE